MFPVSCFVFVVFVFYFWAIISKLVSYYNTIVGHSLWLSFHEISAISEGFQNGRLLKASFSEDSVTETFTKKYSDGKSPMVLGPDSVWIWLYLSIFIPISITFRLVPLSFPFSVFTPSGCSSYQCSKIDVWISNLVYKCLLIDLKHSTIDWLLFVAGFNSIFRYFKNKNKQNFWKSIQIYPLPR